ncbi:hypothetical protein quinque_001727 [Culex quinquefasciatus]
MYNFYGTTNRNWIWRTGRFGSPDWKLNQLDSNNIFEGHGNTSTESPTTTLTVESMSKTGDKDKMGLADVVEGMNGGAGVDGIWTGAQTLQQAERKRQVEGIWKVFCFSQRPNFGTVVRGFSADSSRKWFLHPSVKYLCLIGGSVVALAYAKHRHQPRVYALQLRKVGDIWR